MVFIIKDYIFISEDTKPVKIVEAVSSDPREMQLSWKDEQASSSVPITYHVYHSLRKQLTYCGNTTDKKIKCSRLKPCTEYTFYVRRNDEKVNASISSLTSEDSKSNFRLLCKVSYTSFTPIKHVQINRV